MPARLVYSPKVYCYTQQQDGAILNISNYVVSGQIDRKINQVSSATITLRNPQRRFTQPSSGHVAFHPMDPITIYLERIQGRPVRVFTGYLDTTPYYTLYPKTITLQASCTLKRLLYTYFDPSLPYLNAFFRKYGWYNLNDGTMWNIKSVTEKLDQTGNQLQDTSLGKLLWAILYDIGQWQDGNIYIENLPPDLVQKVANLATNLKQTENTAVKQFELFLSTIIGDGSQGSGGGAGANTNNAANNTTTGSGQVPGTPSGGYTRNSWAIAFLGSLGAPVNDANVVGVMNWTKAEDGNWNNGNKYNPLNTTEPMPGHERGNWNSVGVKLYDNWETGLRATVQTVRNGHYPNILKDIMSGKGNQISNEVSDLRTWGTGSGWNAATPQSHTLKNRLGVATTTRSATATGNATSNVLPPAQRGSKSLYNVTTQATRQTKPGYSQSLSSTVANTGASIGGAISNVANEPSHANQVTRIDAMVSAAATISGQYPYVWGGGHGAAGTPSAGIPGPGYDGHTVGYDCSGTVGAVLAAGGIVQQGAPVPGSGSFGSYSHGRSGVGSGNPECTIFYNSGHVFMRLNGRMFGTGDVGKAGGPAWQDHSTAGFNTAYIPVSKLKERVTYTGPWGGSGGNVTVQEPSMKDMPLSKSNYGHTRSAKDIKLIVLHDSEIEGGSSYFSNLTVALNGGQRVGTNPDWDPQGTGLSVQCAINSDGTIARLMSDLNIPYGAVIANPYSVQVEQAGFARDTTWPSALVDSCAKLVAFWCWKYNIPVKHDTKHGICEHRDLGKAGGNHKDPPPSYPFNQVLQKAQGIIDNASANASANSGGGQSQNSANNASANAFLGQIEAPSLMDMVTATALGGAHMGLMHDQALLPFVQQVCQSSMRSFQSLPNGDFYAFYPDYFGEFGQHNPYWFIDDLEILDGEIQLSDDALATHVYAVGDTTWPISKGGTFAGELMNMLQAGAIDIFGAFGDNGKTLSGTNGQDPVVSADEAVEFIKRYGARPLVQPYPMVRNQYFEMFLAYQQFMLAWSNQFKTPFTFTFMPELFPGGKVAFPDHGLQMYISSVSHSFDYSEGGFTTTAELSAPAVYGKSGDELLPPNMVKMSEAIFEPIKKVTRPKGSTDTQTQVANTLTAQQLTESGQATAAEVNAAMGIGSDSTDQASAEMVQAATVF